MMFISQAVAWAAIAVGALGAGLYWALLAADRIHARPSRRPLHGRGTMRPQQRREAWHWSRYALLVICSGLFILGKGWGSSAARWLVILAACVIIIWDRALWLRHYLSRRRADRLHESA